jgi:hypothetical protein
MPPIRKALSHLTNWVTTCSVHLYNPKISYIGFRWWILTGRARAREKRLVGQSQRGLSRPSIRKAPSHLTNRVTTCSLGVGNRCRTTPKLQGCEDSAKVFIVLKRITVNQRRVGMHVDEKGCLSGNVTATSV